MLHLVLKLFRRLDGLMLRWNENSVTRGVVLINESTDLPADEPVAWRETTKKSLGTTRYLVRILLALEVPVGIFCLLVAVLDISSDSHLFSWAVYGLWPLSLLVASVKAASLIAGERSHQTLDVLLATPLTGRDIILQKYRGVRRLMYVLAVPLLTVFAFEVSCKSGISSNHPWDDPFDPYLYLACSLLSVGIYLPMMAWLSLYIGLRVRTQSRAILGALAAVFG